MFSPSSQQKAPPSPSRPTAGENLVGAPPGFSPSLSNSGWGINNTTQQIASARMDSLSSDNPHSLPSSENPPIQVEIVRSSEEGGSSKYTVYHIEVQTSLKSWTVLRR